MRIAYVLTRSDVTGGAQIHVRDLAEAMAKLGHNVTVLVGGAGALVTELRERRVPCRVLPHLVRAIRPYHDFLALREITRALRELRPDLVHAHSSKAGWLGRIASRRLGIPAIFTAHGWAFTEGTPGPQRVCYTLAERIISQLGAHLITVSEYDRRLALRRLAVDPRQVTTVRNGVSDLVQPSPAAMASGPPHLVTVARSEPQKDHETLFRALARIKDLHWTLEILGAGPLLTRNERRAQQLGIGDRVHFAGERADVHCRMARAHAFLLVSNWEGFPLSILEAMRAALPVIASNVGGVSEAVVDNETGFLVPRADVTVLADRLARLLQNETLRVRMGQAGRRRYEAEFTFGRMLQSILAVYNAVLNERLGLPSQRSKARVPP